MTAKIQPEAGCRRGRPTKLTAEVEERICQMVRIFGAVEPAAKAAAISPRTVHRWLRRGGLPGETNEAYRLFRESFELPRRENAAVLAVALIGYAASISPGDW